MKTLLLLCLLLQLEIPIRYLPGSEDGLIHGHLFTVPVTLNGAHRTEFILDTGIGLNLLSKTLAEKLGCPVTNVTHTGQRMSGQSVTLPLSWVPSLQLGSCKQAFVTTGVWDFREFIPQTKEFAGVEGFLSLNFFQHLPFTLDYARERLILETDESLARRAREGFVVDLDQESEEGVSLTAFLTLEVVGAGKARVEVDTGSDSLILDERFRPAEGSWRTVEGKDETGHRFLRRFGELARGIRLGPLERAPVRVMFQKIIHDGLIGDDFLRHYTVTWDLPRSRLILRGE